MQYDGAIPKLYSNHCLETLYLPKDHIAINIADALETILQSWNLKSEQQVCITTDNEFKQMVIHNVFNSPPVKLLGLLKLHLFW